MQQQNKRKFKVVRKMILKDFEEEVSELLDKGWEPYGQMDLTTTFFSLAMIKQE